MKSDKCVSVVIPMHNRGDTIVRAVKSALRQSYPVYEVIVVDDGSTDDGLHNLQHLNDGRIKSVRLPEKHGGSKARNIGIDLATGDFVAFLDSDDEWLHDHIKNSVQYLERSGASGVFSSFYADYGGWRRMFPAHPVTTADNMATYILSAGYGDPRTSTFVMERIIVQNLRFDESLAKYQDWDLAIRFASLHRLDALNIPGAIMYHNQANRMSATVDHAAVRQFTDLYIHEVCEQARVRFYLNMAVRTALAGGQRDIISKYVNQAIAIVNAPLFRQRVMARAVLLPGFAAVYVIARRVVYRIRKAIFRFRCK